ncbi:hypothetical protein [Pontibacter sp. G13]|uniref:hypothetical protein n=1 Tax=Pontibacter sp. G13 TaxID=3074898 RepID=UPI002889B769|nr:hypothetical protein [Pontibacter sp. G13]WNJ17522.1 hypothetical protein RJD25_21955 [Pontibacter sp. G13]
MKYSSIAFALLMMTAFACSSNDSGHSHDHGEGEHTHEHGEGTHTHDHAHEEGDHEAQETFSVELDSAQEVGHSHEEGDHDHE